MKLIRSLPLSNVAWLPLLALFVWDLNDASAPKAVPSATLFLGLGAAILAVSLVPRLRACLDVPRTPLYLVAGCLVVGLVMIPFRDDFYPSYALKDVGTLLFFLLCLAVATAYRHELPTTATVFWFTVLYVIVAIAAYVASVTNLRPEYWWNGRWDPPYFMLFGALALFLRYSERNLHRILAAAVLVIMLGLALTSGNRTQFALGLLFVGLAWASNRLALIGAAVAGLLYVVLHLLGWLPVDPLADVFAKSRFALLEGGMDASLSGRWAEMSDIWQYLTVLNTPHQTILGRGAGATWDPITRVLAGDPTDVHYLHIGITHMTFRFGLVGLALFVYWIWMSVANIRIMFDSRATLGERFWYLGALGFSLNFFLQNSLYDPPAVLAMATLLVLARDRSSSRDEPREGSRWSAIRDRVHPGAE